MIKRRYVFCVSGILVFILIFLVVSWSLDSIAQNSVRESNLLLPNRGFYDILNYNDSLSDSGGDRAYPWGIEIWNGSPSSYFTIGQVQLIGHSLIDVVVLAIPNPSDKPRVTAGVSYTQSFEVKLENVSGRRGIRLIYQSFNSDSAQHNIIQTYYGKWENGSSDWHKISFSATPVSGSVVGDVILELWGSGTVYVRNADFHTTTMLDKLATFDPTNLPYLAVASITALVTLVILVSGGLSIVALLVSPIKNKREE